LGRWFDDKYFTEMTNKNLILRLPGVLESLGLGVMEL
jgi:hypothetical protein